MQTNDPSYYLLQSGKPRVILNTLRRLIFSILPTLFAVSLWIYFILDISQKATSSLRKNESKKEPKNKSLAEDATSQILSFDAYLPVFQLPPGMKEPLFLSQVNPSILIPVKPYKNNQLSSSNNVIHRKKHTVAHISSAHEEGLIHMGSSLFIVDSENKMLFLKRSKSLVLCPDTWSNPGEHQKIHDLRDGFDMKHLVVRAVREELGLDPERNIKELVPLTDFPVYFRKEYGPFGGNRIDRQLTYLAYVRLRKPHRDINFDYDEEVADFKWVDISAAREFAESIDICHGFLHALFEVGIGSILSNATYMN